MSRVRRVRLPRESVKEQRAFTLYDFVRTFVWHVMGHALAWHVLGMRLGCLGYVRSKYTWAMLMGMVYACFRNYVAMLDAICGMLQRRFGHVSAML